MNIVYLLTNVSKSSYPKYYIGSKVECDIVPVAGFETIISLKTGKAYYGSSCNREMQRDLSLGNNFKAEVLEVVGCRKDLRKKEQEWLEEFNTAEDCRYYNLTNNALSPTNWIDMDSVVNIFGESYKNVAKSRGSIGKRNLTAKSFGFKDFYDLVIFIAKEVKGGKSYAEISRMIGSSNRHFPLVTTRSFDLNRVLKENPLDYIEEVEDYYFLNASIEMIANKVGIEVPTAYKAIVHLVDNFEKPDFISLVVSKKLGVSMDNLESKIAKSVFNGNSLAKIASELKIDRRSATKYFIRFFRKRFKANDFE